VQILEADNRTLREEHTDTLWNLVTLAYTLRDTDMIVQQSS
jgi:hypothetical protein